MTAPQWSPVDDETADLLTLVADDGSAIPSKAEEWDKFINSLRLASTVYRDSKIYPNELRALTRGNIAPRRIGAFTTRALRAGLVEYTGEWQVSDDTEGRNSGKPARVMRWVGDQR